MVSLVTFASSTSSFVSSFASSGSFGYAFVRAVTANMAPAAALVTLGSTSFSFAFRYLIRLTRGVSWPTVSIVIPPVTIFVVFAGLVTIWIFFFAFPVNLADLLVYVI